MTGEFAGFGYPDGGGEALAVTLRNAHIAVIDRNKVVDYLLNAAHPDNGGKARFFESFGFPKETPELLINALRAAAHTGDVVEATESVHGVKYIVEAALAPHTGTRHARMLRTVWIIDHGAEAPRLVTAYPRKE